MIEEKILSKDESDKIIEILKARFENNMNRHEGLDWANIQTKLERNTKRLWSLNQMELTKGEPDVISYDPIKDEYIFYDCSPESPSNRRSLCYDKAAFNSRKENKPKNNALDLANYIGIDILSKEQYQDLQKVGKFDTKTSSWVVTPDDIRKLGGAIFCDRRYNHVFVYHNGAESYYASRGFRGSLRV